MKPAQGIVLIVTIAAATAGGWWLGQRSGSHEGQKSPSTTGSGPCPGGAEALYWKAPMDPTYVREAPGKSPMGMDLVPVCPGDESSIGGSGVRIDPNLVQSMGIRTAPVERRDLSRNIRTLGRVAYDERRVEHIHTKVQGWVERLFVEYEGEMVERGQPLLEIYSPELVSTQEELLLAARYRDATRGSQFDDVSQGGEDLFDATRRRLELWDVSDNDIDRLLESREVRKDLTLYAPTEGVVSHLMVRKGMELGPNDNLYTIADLSTVWLYADVYEYELPWVAKGQQAVVDLSYLPGRSFEGIVTYVYPFLDPKTRTARVRIELENPDLILKPDMFANVNIETETQENVLAVPDEAIIRSGRRSLAVVALGEGRFEPREISLGIDAGDGWLEVRDGLEEGEIVVTSGQFLIDSESKLQEAVQKMLGSATEAESREHADDAPLTDPHAGHDMAGEAPDPHAGHDMQAPRKGEDPHDEHDMASPPDEDPHTDHTEH